MAFLDFIFGKKEKIDKVPRYTPEQERAISTLLSQSQKQLPQAYKFLRNILSQDPSMMEQFQAPARRSFEEKTVPTIAERFTGTFGPGAQKSAAFGQQLGQAGAALEEALSAQRAGLGMDAISRLQNLLGGGLTQTYEPIFRPATPGFLGSALAPVAGGFGSALGTQLGTSLFPVV